MPSHPLRTRAVEQQALNTDVNGGKFCFASRSGPSGNLVNMRLREWDLRVCISYKLPGCASSDCLVTTLLCSKVPEDSVKFLLIILPLSPPNWVRYTCVQQCAGYYPLSVLIT